MNEIFRFTDTFEINQNITVNSHIEESNLTWLSIDNCLKNYDQVYKIVSNTPVAAWKTSDETTNFIDYKEGRLQYPLRQTCNLVELCYASIKHYFNLETDFQFGSIDVNVFQQIKPKTNDFNIIHTDQHDLVKQSFTCLLFLNQPLECSGGTAFFQHVPTGLVKGNTTELGNLLLPLPELYHNGKYYWNQDKESKIWKMINYAEMISNRLIIFPSDYFHTAYHPINSFYNFSRLTLVFWMKEI